MNTIQMKEWKRVLAELLGGSKDREVQEIKTLLNIIVVSS